MARLFVYMTFIPILRFIILNYAPISHFKSFLWALFASPSMILVLVQSLYPVLKYGACLVLFGIKVHKSFSFFPSRQFSSSPYHCMTSVCESLCFAIRTQALTKTATSVYNSWISSAGVRRGQQRLPEVVSLWLPHPPAPAGYCDTPSPR